MPTNKPDTMLWLSEARGIYIPQHFANSFANRDQAVRGVSAEDWAILEAGPDHEYYWDTWTDVCDRAIVTDDVGTQYRVHQDGDCWLIPVGMEWNDDKDFFVWPEAEQDPDHAREDQPERNV